MLKRILTFALVLLCATPVLAQQTRSQNRDARIETDSRLGRFSVPDTADVLLDIPQLKVEQIKLEVEELSARLSLDARVANLVQLRAGADVEIGQVNLDITGVEAQALLMVNLHNVRRIIVRTLETLENNPELIESLTSALNETVGTVGNVANQALGTVGQTVNSLAQSGCARPDGEQPRPDRPAHRRSDRQHRRDDGEFVEPDPRPEIARQRRRHAGAARDDERGWAGRAAST